MARARRKPVQGTKDMGKTIVRATGKGCPVCGRPPEAFTLTNDLESHLRTHAPTEPCRSCGDKAQ